MLSVARSARAVCERHPGRISLVIVGAFAMAAVALLGRTTLEARAISADINDAITPDMTEVTRDTEDLARLARTVEIAQGLESLAVPIGQGLRQSRTAVGRSGAAMTAVRAHIATIGENVVDSDASVASITESSLASIPLSAGIAAETGDIAALLSRTAVTMDQVGRAVTGLVGHSAALTDRMGVLGNDLDAVRRRLAGVATHTENIAAARILRQLEQLRPVVDALPIEQPVRRR